MNCRSSIHDKPVVGTVRGSYGHPDNGLIEDVWYCDKCAATGTELRLFHPYE